MLYSSIAVHFTFIVVTSNGEATSIVYTYNGNKIQLMTSRPQWLLSALLNQFSEVYKIYECFITL